MRLRHTTHQRCALRAQSCATARAVAAPAAAACAAAILATACQRYPYDPEKATRPYPDQLKQTEVGNVQVIPDIEGGTITVVNASATGYKDFDLWLNRRYMRHIPELNPGQSLVLEIDSFWDERGEGPFPGGWFRYYQPTPIVLAQIQLAPDKPLVGLATTHPVEGSR